MTPLIPYHQLLQLVYRYNILPVNSACNIQCSFCSHLQNPGGIESYRVPSLSWDQTVELVDFLSGDRKIVIGESVSRVMEGEPFIFPRFMKVLELIRRKFPRTLISITTNGSRLTEEIVQELAHLMPMEINLSLNSSRKENREKLLKDAHAEIAVKSPSLLAQYGVPYHGSIVAMPHITGWEDLDETIRYMDGWNARTIRIFQPGYTRWCRREVKPDFTVDMLLKYINGLEGIQCPLIVEPGMCTDLTPDILGVMRDTPAKNLGLLKGDIILSINDEVPFSRADAFLKLQKNSVSRITLQRDGEQSVLTLSKGEGEPSGVVMAYDVHPSVPGQIESTIRKYQAKNPILATSRMAYKILRAATETLIEEIGLRLKAVDNHFFGGNISTAGLLVVEDFLKDLEGEEGDVILLPPIAFDENGKDLRGQSYLEIEEKLGICAALPL